MVAKSGVRSPSSGEGLPRRWSAQVLRTGLSVPSAGGPSSGLKSNCAGSFIDRCERGISVTRWPQRGAKRRG